MGNSADNLTKMSATKEGEGERQTDGRWTVRGVSHDARQAAAKAAEAADETVGEWLTRVILEAFRADRARQRLPAVLADTADAADMATVEAVVTVMRRMQEAGVPPSRRLTGRIHKILLNRLRSGSA